MGSYTRCAAITRAGQRCRLDATHGSYCYQHSPETQAERQRNATRGGKAGGNGRGGVSELAGIKRDIRQVVDSVREGHVERSIGAVVFQGFNVLLKAVEVERKVKETDELLERVKLLEAEQGAQPGPGARTWG